KSAPRYMTATLDCQSIPNQMMNSGTSTMRGVAYRKFTNGSSAYCTRVYQPMTMPRSRPEMDAATYPVPNSKPLVPRSAQMFCRGSVNSFTNASPTSTGPGRKSTGTIRATATKCQVVENAATATVPMMTAS